jgi:hypothetical protein
MAILLGRHLVFLNKTWFLEDRFASPSSFSYKEIISAAPVLIFSPVPRGPGVSPEDAFMFSPEIDPRSGGEGGFRHTPSPFLLPSSLYSTVHLLVCYKGRSMVGCRRVIWGPAGNSVLVLLSL